MTDLCVLCGKKVSGKPRWWVNFDAETQTVVAPDVVTPGTGMMPIGSECRKTVATGWVIDRSEGLEER